MNWWRCGFPPLMNPLCFTPSSTLLQPHSLPIHIYSCSRFSYKVDLSFVEPEPYIISVVVFQEKITTLWYKIRYKHEYLFGMRKKITAKSKLKYLENTAIITKCRKIIQKTYLTNSLTHSYNAFLSFGCIFFDHFFKWQQFYNIFL